MSDTSQSQNKADGKGFSVRSAAERETAQAPEIASLLDGAAIDGLAEPEFRVLSLMGERKGIRLEAVFWRALDKIASDLGVPRSTLVLWITSAAGHDRSNATSVIRSVIVAYLLNDIERRNSFHDGV